MAEREVKAKEHKFGLIENKKQELRKFSDTMSNNLRLLSTKVPYVSES